VFGHLKKYKRILVDSRDPIITGGDEVKAEQLATSFREECPDAVEEIDCNLPIPLVGELAITTFVDSDHAHDKVTQRFVVMTGVSKIVRPPNSPLRMYLKVAFLLI